MGRGDKNNQGLDIGNHGKDDSDERYFAQDIFEGIGSRGCRCLCRRSGPGGKVSEQATGAATLFACAACCPRTLTGRSPRCRADGYTVVEAAGFYDHSAADFRKAMDKAGLRCVSAHYTLALLETQLDQLIEYAHTLGLEYMVCSSSGGHASRPRSQGRAHARRLALDCRASLTALAKR